ncbi:MAG: hypothetical protein ABW352_08625 [Polyangiales bacterium]
MTGCEDGINFCTDNNRDDAGQCREIPDFPNDGGLDATTPPSDATTPPDAFVPDTSLPAIVDSGLDAATDATVDATTPPTSLSVEGFCDARYRVAKAWRDKFEECNCPNTTIEDRGIFLLGGLLYDDGNGDATESVQACVTRLNAAIGPNLTFTGTAAAGCAAKFAGQFAEPPATCPAGGFKIDELEAANGKQAQELTQLTECRAALAGKLALNAACTDSYQCQGGLRCLSGVCRDGLASGTVCGRTEQCADGLVCVGGTSPGGRVCRPKAMPAAVTAACTFSVECDPGALCGATNQCTLATSRAICQ